MRSDLVRLASRRPSESGLRCVRTKYFSPKGPNGGEIQCAFADRQVALSNSTLCRSLSSVIQLITRVGISLVRVRVESLIERPMRVESADIARPRRSALAAGKRPSTRVVKCDAQCTERHSRADFIGSGVTLAYLRGGHTGWGELR